MSFSTETATQSPRSNRPARRRPSSWSELWLKNTKSLNHVIQAMQFQNLSSSSPKSPKNPSVVASDFAGIEIDRTVLLPDEVVLRILAKVPDSQRSHNFLVCKRWLDLQGRLVRSLKVLDWGFLESGRLISRFPNLSHVNLVRGCVISPRNVGILMHRGGFSLELGTRVSPDWRVLEENLLPSEVVDEGLRILANGCTNLRKLEVIGATEMGVLSVAEECSILQELELHRCSDNVLRGIAACTNLQVLKLIGNVDGLYGSVVSDIGLTILAQGCKRLVKLELGGCEGSFDGIKAIGQCCHMLEELTLSDHRMEGGWLAGLSYCENLKTLRFQSCRSIDSCPEVDEYLGSCPTVERLHMQKCQLRDKQSLRALFTMCRNVKEIVIQDCWGLDNGSFCLASICRSVKFLSLEGCSLLTTEGLESVILHYKDLESLRVVSCNNIRDSEVSPSLSTLFSILKELKWRPDTKSLLSSCLEGTCVRKKGSKFFRKTLKL